tara:strand:+ start:1440 stop:1784 length:345 start_codon:yes stop_codon:yes gene_type:complete
MKGENVQMISSKKNIKFILEEGKKFFGEFLTIIYINDNSLTNHLELLISVPKKKIKLAVNRNKVKRRIRSFFFDKTNHKLKEIKIIIIFQHFEPINYSKIKRDIITFQKKILIK